MYDEQNKEFVKQPEQPFVSDAMDDDIIPIPPRNRKNLMPIIICGIFAALLLLEIAIFGVSVYTIRQENTRYLPDASIIMQEQNKAFSFGPEGREVTVRQVEDTGWTEGIPKGFKLVRMNCQLGYQEKYISRWDCEAYLQVNGVYYGSADNYELEKLNPSFMVHTLQAYQMLSQGTEEGWIYFVVPKDMKEATVWLNVLERDADYAVVGVESTGIPVSFEKGEDDNA